MSFKFNRFILIVLLKTFPFYSYRGRGAKLQWCSHLPNFVSLFFWSLFPWTRNFPSFLEISRNKSTNSRIRSQGQEVRGDLQDKSPLFDGSQENYIVTPKYKNGGKRIFEFGVRPNPPHWPSKFKNHHYMDKHRHRRNVTSHHFIRLL